MSSLFDFEPKVDAYGVMGNPIAHSKSPQIHQSFAAQTQQSISYDAILVDPGGLPQAVGNFVANGGKGLNITVPFKKDAWNLVDTLSERARLAGAVNTIAVQEDKTLFGDNTDGIGLIRDLSNNHNVTLQGKRILLVGAGGAARGVLGPLLDGKPEQLTLCNRTLKTAQELLLDFSEPANCTACTFDSLPPQPYDVLINATSASLQGEAPPLANTALHQNSVCYDMMYGAQPTPFMLWAQQRGAGYISDGLGMLVEQAAESFYIWRKVRPDSQIVIHNLRNRLQTAG
ncbi:MAG: shikimate dehydrogenase [Gammaproteobacteria bacterium]|nr:shikimate dehydrogenase [Gammaproteobacteria bacterium]MDH5800295.1 shikimate dehydrogenase [Gammaproteobacteria bacterium]